eukprot:m.392927 g.392927  ORF g.392927 m.392927 type:complete len:232 (+) comp21087_c0_seq2:219-914(+)
MPTRAEVFKNLGLDTVIHDDTVVFVCLQTLFKLTPDFDAVFRNILERTPTARLLFKSFRTKQVAQRLLTRMQATMSTVYDRVIMLEGLSEVNWYGLLRHSTVVLDSYPFGGYTTSLESMSAGNTPIVTLPHKLMAGRCTAGFLRILGIDDTIARDKNDYADIAVRLADDVDFRQGVEAQIRTNAHLLWNRKSTIAEWEQFLEEVVAGKSVTNLHIKRPEWRRLRSKMHPQG